MRMGVVWILTGVALTFSTQTRADSAKTCYSFANHVLKAYGYKPLHRLNPKEKPDNSWSVSHDQESDLPLIRATRTVSQHLKFDLNATPKRDSEGGWKLELRVPPMIGKGTVFHFKLVGGDCRLQKFELNGNGRAYSPESCSKAALKPDAEDQNSPERIAHLCDIGRPYFRKPLKKRQVPASDSQTGQSSSGIARP